MCPTLIRTDFWTSRWRRKLPFLLKLSQYSFPTMLPWIVYVRVTIKQLPASEDDISGSPRFVPTLIKLESCIELWPKAMGISLTMYECIDIYPTDYKVTLDGNFLQFSSCCRGRRTSSPSPTPVTPHYRGWQFCDCETGHLASHVTTTLTRWTLQHCSELNVFIP